MACYFAQVGFRISPINRNKNKGPLDMRGNVRLFTYFVIFLFLTSYGCSEKKEAQPESSREQITRDTVSSLCELTGYAPLRVSGYSLVLGLSDTGSSECDPLRKKYLIKEIGALKAQNVLTGYYGSLSAEDIISDKTTSVVLVTGTVPAGAPKGELFDVKVVPLSYTQTTSLQGGYLMRTQLRVTVPGQSSGVLAGRPVAEAEGSVFVNPFSPEQSSSNPRLGSVIAGGKSLYDRKIYLSILNPDYRIAQQIKRQINTRFQPPGQPEIADADRSKITLTIPESYRTNYQRFISLIMLLNVQDRPGFVEQRLKELDEMVRKPGANYPAIALIWESIGKNALPYIEPLYQDSASLLGFYAARTAVALEDRKAIDTLADMALQDGHPAQILATEAMKDFANDTRARLTLAKLIDSSNTRIRLLAYEGLRTTPDRKIRSRGMPGGFSLDRVESGGENLICVWAVGAPRLVIFGKDPALTENFFFESSDKLVTLDAKTGEPRIKIIRQLPHWKTFVSLQTSRELDFLVQSLAMTLPSPDGTKPGGAELSFSQIVGILYSLCQNHILDSQFYIHKQPEESAG